jgi:hypothetical protein
MVKWGDVPTWVTAGVALLAFLGAGAAYRFRAEHVRLQRQQLADQQDATRLEAGVIAAQNRLLEREQANKIDVAVTTVLGGDAQMLPPEKNEPVHVVVVSNGSNRPVRNVACKVEAWRLDGVRETTSADAYGEMRLVALGSTAQAEAFAFGARDRNMPVLRAGRKGAFPFPFACSQYRRLVTWVRFTDDDQHWEIHISLHPKKLESRDW